MLQYSLDMDVVGSRGQFRVYLLLVFLLGIFSSKQSFAKREDTLESQTRYSLMGVFFQSFEAYRHFMRKEELEMDYFTRQRLEQDPEYKLAQKVVPSSLAWNFGLGFGTSTSPAADKDVEITDTTYASMLGLSWDISSRLATNLHIGYDSLPDEAYTHGSVYLRVEYLIYTKSLFNKKKKSKYDPNDAIQYYRYQSMQNMAKLDEKVSKVSRAPAEADDEDTAVPSDSGSTEIEDTYPVLRLAYHLGFDRHQIGAKTYRRFSTKTRNGGRLFTEGALTNQFLNGIEATYAPNEKWNFGILFKVNRYSELTDSFVAKLEMDRVNRIPISMVGSWLGFTNEYLAFADTTIDEFFDFYFSEKETLSLNFNQTFYAPLQLNPTYAFSPAYFREMNPRWRLAVGANTFFGNDIPFVFSGVFSLTYKL